MNIRTTSAVAAPKMMRRRIVPLVVFGTVLVAAVCVAVGLRLAHGTDSRGDIGAEKAPRTLPGKESGGNSAAGRPTGKLEKIRDFALREAPSMWNAYQRLGTEIDVQARKIEDLRKDMVDFGRDPDADAGFRQLMGNLQEMRRMRAGLMEKMENAYLAKAKYDATPGHGDTEALWKKAQEDGIQEAEAAERRFLEMKESK